MVIGYSSVDFSFFRRRSQLDNGRGDNLTGAVDTSIALKVKLCPVCSAKPYNHTCRKKIESMGHAPGIGDDDLRVRLALEAVEDDVAEVL